MRAKRFIFLVFFLIAGCHSAKHRYQGYIEGETLYLAVPFSGILQIMHVQRGQHVHAGQLLFDLDPNPQAFALQQAKASLAEGIQTWIDLKKPKRIPEIDAIKAQIAQAEAGLSLAAIRVKRNQILFDKHVGDKDTLDAAIEELRQKEGDKALYEANLALAMLGARPNQITAQQDANQALNATMAEAAWNIGQKKIYAPAAGIIFDTYYRTGEYVGAEHPVASLLTAANTRIEFFVPLQDLQDIALGKVITYRYPGMEKPLSAVVSYISPTAEYMPPLVYSRENSDKIVFRIKAAATRGAPQLISGAPVTVMVDATHAR